MLRQNIDGEAAAMFTTCMGIDGNLPQPPSLSQLTMDSRGDHAAIELTPCGNVPHQYIE